MKETRIRYFFFVKVFWPLFFWNSKKELALLNVRYQLDKLINQNSIVARYEAELEEFLKNEKIIKEEHRNEEVEARFWK